MSWTPNAKQAIALSCPAEELFYGGAKGGGKTDFLLMDFFAGANEYKDYSGVLFRQSFPELEEVIKRSRQLFRQHAEYQSTTKTWTFKNGATLKLRFLEKEDDTSSYQGHQYQWIGWDELANYATNTAYLEMLSCLRSAAGIPCRCRATGNPGKKGHFWVKARFIDPAEPYSIFDTGGMSRAFIPATLDDNVHLRENDPMYEKRLEELPSHLYKAFRFGDWNSFEGAYFTSWDEELHVVKPFTLSPWSYKFCSLDWGFAKPYSIGFWAVKPEGSLVRYRELYGCIPGKPNTGLRQSTEEVVAKLYDYAATEGITDVVADPACWGDHGHTSGPVITSFQKHFTCHRGNNDRRLGIEKFNEMLSTVDQHGVPMLTVFETCKDFIRTIPSLMPAKNNPEDIDSDMEDHIYDDARYAIMSPLSRTVSNFVPEYEPAYDPLA